MSTTNSAGLVVKSKLSPHCGSVALRQWNSIKMGYKIFFFGKYYPTSKCVKNETDIALKHSLGSKRKSRSDENGQIVLP